LREVGELLAIKQLLLQSQYCADLIIYLDVAYRELVSPADILIPAQLPLKHGQDLIVEFIIQEPHVLLERSFLTECLGPDDHSNELCCGHTQNRLIPEHALIYLIPAG
jgi:hypothetical protein